jgi:hypothetical protein
MESQALVNTSSAKESMGQTSLFNENALWVMQIVVISTLKFPVPIPAPSLYHYQDQCLVTSPLGRGKRKDAGAGEKERGEATHMT